MDFHGLHRRSLQALCKKNGIPANLTNAAMVQALASLQTVILLDEEEEAAPQTPLSLRPPNPSRSCRRSSVLSLLKQIDDDDDATLSKKKRTGRQVLFPCSSDHHVSDEMPQSDIVDTDTVSNEKEMRVVVTDLNSLPDQDVDMMNYTKEDCLNEANAALENSALKKNDISASEEMVEEFEGKEDVMLEDRVREEIDANEEPYLDEAVKLPCTQELACDDGREMDVDGLKRADTGELLASEDKHAVEMTRVSQGDEVVASSTGNNVLVSASRGSLDEAARLLNFQESANAVKDEENGHLQSQSILVLGSVEQDKDLKADHDLKGEMEDKSLNNLDSESEQVLGSEEMRENLDADTMNSLGTAGQYQVTKDVVCEVLREEVEEHKLCNRDSEYKDKFISGESEDMNTIMMKENPSEFGGGASEVQQNASGEDKHVADTKCIIQGDDEVVVSFTGKHEVASGTRGSLDEAVRLQTSQEPVNNVKEQENGHMRSPSLLGLEFVEQDKGTKADEESHGMKGEMENNSLMNVDSEYEEVPVISKRSNESEQIPASGEMSENLYADMMDSLGTTRHDQAIKDVVSEVLSGEVEEHNTDSKFEDKLISGESKDVDATKMKENNEADEMLDITVHVASETERDASEVRQNASDNCISPFESEAKDHTLDGKDCCSKAVSLVEFQDSGFTQQVMAKEKETIEMEVDVTDSIIVMKGKDTEIPANEDLIQKSPCMLDCSDQTDLNKEDQIDLNKEDMTSFIEDEVTKSSSSAQVLPTENNPISDNMEPSGNPSEVGDEPEVGNTTLELHSDVKQSVLDSNAEVEADVKVEAVTKVEVASKKRSAKKAGLTSLSLRKLKAMYKENKQVGDSDKENKAEGDTRSEETKREGELEKPSSEKTRFNGLSLRQLKLMYKNKVGDKC